ncbi:MAG: glutaredoxin family protein [Woeseiaceae bacterium]
MTVFDVYSRRGCHLCELLVESLLEVLAGCAEVRIHDIDADPELRREYDTRVPVVKLGDKFVCEFRLDKGAVRSALAEKA